MSNILWLSVVWIAPLVCFLLTNEAKFKKNIAVGVTLSFEARNDAAVQAALKKFRRSEWIVCGLLLALAAAGWAVDGENMTIWIIWIELCIILPYVPYVMTNHSMKNLKKERGWGMHSSVQNIRVNTSAMTEGKWFSAWAFLPAVVLCLVPLAFDRSMWIMNLVLAVCNVLFWFGYRYAYRNKSEMVDDNVELTRVLTQVRRYNWGRMWLLTAYSLAFMNIGVMVTMHSALWSMILYIAFMVVVVGAALWVELNTRRVQEKLTRESGHDWYVDEDDKWIGGLLYYNTNDSRLVINNRVGINSSVNAAHPAGKILIILIVVLLLALPFAGTFIGGGDVTLTVEDGVVRGVNGRTEYVIEMDDLQSAQILEELPDNMVRNFGTAMPTLLKGDFTASEIGHVKVCLDPTVPPFLLIETNEGKAYLLGSRTAGAAEAAYDALTE